MSRSRLRGLGLVTAALLAAVTLGTPAAAQGTTGTVAGMITDGGAPVASAYVQIQASDGSFLAAAATDDFGGYFIPDVPAAADAYVLMVQVAGHPVQFHPGVLDSESATLLSVSPDQTTTVDEALLPTGTITGHLRDAAGNGAPNVGVSADPDSGSGSSSASTDADGAYAVHVVPGTYRVSFFTGGQTQFAFGTRDFSAAALFTVAVGQTVTVDDALLPVGSLTGTVTYADGTPAADVSVQLEGDNDSAFTTSSSDGTYRFDSVVPGSYTVLFVLPSGAAEWAHHAFSRDDATRFTVVADQTTTADEQLPPTGVLAGRFTDRAGNGIAGLSVNAEGRSPTSTVASGSTDADGFFRIDRVFPGQYTVGFISFETNLTQWAFGKIRFEDADVVTVTADQTTTVDDQKLPTGSLKVTAKDSITGAPIQNFSIDLGNRFGSTENGEAVIDDLAIGTYQITASAEGYAYSRNVAAVTITEGNQSVVQISLLPVGKITTKVVDRKTGRGVADVCVFVETKTTFVFPDGCPARTDENGNITVTVDNPGTYNLFALPDRGSAYGAQWVTASGGTGSQDEAVKITVKAGKTVAAPRIKLDKHGTIAGKVTSTTGQPLVNGHVGILGPDTGAGADFRYVSIAPDGSYSVDFLGPYEWPLLFGARDHAYQWSGGVGNRLKATKVAVSAGKTTKFNYKMKVGTDVTITSTAPFSDNSRYLLENAVTGDVMGIVDGLPASNSVHLRMIGPQTVKVGCFCGPTGFVWLGGTDFASATPVAIPASGSKEIIFTVP